jgi:MATE family multidrug resistance protein
MENHLNIVMDINSRTLMFLFIFALKTTEIEFIYPQKEFSYNLRLAYPIIAGMLGHTIVGIVDNVMVGN